MVHVAINSVSLYLINIINILNIVCFAGLLKRNFGGVRLINIWISDSKVLTFHSIPPHNKPK